MGANRCRRGRQATGSEEYLVDPLHHLVDYRVIAGVANGDIHPSRLGRICPCALRARQTDHVGIVVEQPVTDGSPEETPSDHEHSARVNHPTHYSQGSIGSRQGVEGGWGWRLSCPVNENGGRSARGRWPPPATAVSGEASTPLRSSGPTVVLPPLALPHPTRLHEAPQHPLPRPELAADRGSGPALAIAEVRRDGGEPQLSSRGLGPSPGLARLAGAVGGLSALAGHKSLRQ